MFVLIQLRIFDLPAFRIKNKGNEMALDYRSLNFCRPEVRSVPLNESVEQRAAKVAVRLCLVQNGWCLECVALRAKVRHSTLRDGEVVLVCCTRVSMLQCVQFGLQSLYCVCSYEFNR
jgi:hypothetical protein